VRFQESLFVASCRVADKVNDSGRSDRRAQVCVRILATSTLAAAVVPTWLLAYSALRNSEAAHWNTYFAPTILPPAFPVSGAAVSKLTHVRSAIDQGDPHAAEQQLPLVYDELRKLAARKLAREKPGQTLQGTALVHEAYLRLVGSGGGESAEPTRWDSRGHFFAAAAEATRRILVNRALEKRCLKRGGGWNRVDLDRLGVVDDASDEDLIAIDEALERLAQASHSCADLVKLRTFAGLTLEQAATSLGLARRTADRYWAYARSQLYELLRNEPSEVTP
jgi:RNA polymerase sigma factor (TIGR02999 family)